MPATLSLSVTRRSPLKVAVRRSRGAVRVRAAKEPEIQNPNELIPGFGKEDAKIAFRKGDKKDRVSAEDVFSGVGVSGGKGLDASGRQTTGLGVYRYTSKYGGNIDTYAPIYTPAAFGDDLITGCSDETYLLILAGCAALFTALPLSILALASANQSVGTGVFPFL